VAICYLEAMNPVSRIFRVAALAAGFAVAVLPRVAHAQDRTSDRILAASSLPRLASDLRDAGVPPAEVAKALNQMREAKVSPADAGRVLRAEYQVRLKDRAPSVEFGAMVQEQLRKGVRGPSLADAITAARQVKRTPKPVSE
jgi:hypothetical protein